MIDNTPGCPASELSWEAPGVAALGLIIPSVTLIGFAGSPLIPQIQCPGGPLVIGGYALVGAGGFLEGGSITPSCQVNVVRLGQCQGIQNNPPHWGGEIYGYPGLTQNKTICSLGCALTSLSIALLNQRVSVFPVMGAAELNDPGHLNSFMLEHFIDYDFSNNVRPDETVRDVSAALGLAQTLHFNLDFEGHTNPDDLKTILCTYGQPIIVGVTSRLTGRYGGHYVLVTGELDTPAGTDFTIADPFGDPANADPSKRPYTLLSQYGPFFIWGFVQDPGGDVSGLDLSAGGDVQVLITDFEGRSTGFNAVSGQTIETIPHSAYFQDSLDDDEVPGFHTPVSHSVDIFQPSPGTYAITIIGTSPGIYTLALRPFSQDGGSQPPLTVRGVAASASRSSFLVQFTSTPGTASTVSRLATSQSTLADIANSLQFGLIDNDGIANALSAKINAASDAAARRDSATASNVLNAFKNQVSAQTGKHVTGVASQVLQEDADSLISQLR